MSLSSNRNLDLFSVISGFRSSSQKLVDKLQKEIQLAVDKITVELNELEEKRLASLSLRSQQFYNSQVTAEKVFFMANLRYLKKNYLRRNKRNNCTNSSKKDFY